MIYKEERKDLFTVGSEYYLAHCISADFGMGKGIVVEFNKRFNMKNILTQKYFPYSLIKYQLNHGYCIREGKVLNLITKEKYSDKPTLNSLKMALEDMKEICIREKILKIAMPKIGCGLDKLNWIDVKQLLFETFQDTEIKIFVCYI